MNSAHPFRPFPQDQKIIWNWNHTEPSTTSTVTQVSRASPWEKFGFVKQDSMLNCTQYTHPWSQWKRLTARALQECENSASTSTYFCWNMFDVAIGTRWYKNQHISQEIIWGTKSNSHRARLFAWHDFVLSFQSFKGPSQTLEKWYSKWATVTVTSSTLAPSCHTERGPEYPTSSS